MNYKIREAVLADKSRIKELYLEMLKSVYHCENVQGYQEKDLDRFFMGKKDRIYVAQDSEVVGFLSVEVHHEQNHYIYLDDFSVTEKYRNMGIGTKLIDAAESYARKNGIPAVLLHVEKTNESAMGLYEKLGYTIYRNDGHRFLMKKDILPEKKIKF